MLSGIKGIIKFILTLTGLQFIIGYQGFNASWWFMSVIILSYLMYPKILVYLKKYKHKFLFICFILTFLDIINLGSFKLLNIISWIFPFILGVYISEENVLIKIKRYISNRSTTKILMVILMILMLYIRQAIDPQGVLAIRLDYFLALIIIINTYIFFRLDNILSKIFIYLSKHSMNMFYVHMFISNYYLKDFTYSLNNPIMMFLFTLSMSLICSILLNKLKKIIKFDYYVNKGVDNLFR